MAPTARRDFLAVAGAVAVAGCLQSSDPSSDDSDGTNPPEDAADDGESTADEPDPSGLDDPDPSDLDDLPTGTPPPTDGDFPESCPTYDRVEDVVCYDAVDPTTADAYLAPHSRTVTPDEAIEFSLVNRAETRLATNFYDWRVHKLVDGEWFYVAPQGHPDPLTYLDRGETHAWSVDVDNDGVEAGAEVDRFGAGDSDLRLRGVGGGYYAFRARGWFEGDGHTDDVAFAATFELDADPIQVTPTDAIEATEWDGDTLVATSSRGDPPGDASRLGAFELRRVEDPAGTPQTVIAEQVLGNDQLRDALALSIEHDADRVRLEEYDTTTPIFGPRTDGSYEFDGAYYEVSTREIEE